VLHYSKDKKGKGRAEMAKKNEESNNSRAIAKAIVEQYKPTTVEEMQDARRDIFGPMFEAMFQGKMDNHLGYESNDRETKSTSNRRNGYTDKTIKSSIGEKTSEHLGIGTAALSRSSSQNEPGMSVESRTRC